MIKITTTLELKNFNLREKKWSKYLAINFSQFSAEKAKFSFVIEGKLREETVTSLNSSILSLSVGPDSTPVFSLYRMIMSISGTSTQKVPEGVSFHSTSSISCWETGTVLFGSYLALRALTVFSKDSALASESFALRRQFSTWLWRDAIWVLESIVGLGHKTRF